MRTYEEDGRKRETRAKNESALSKAFHVHINICSCCVTFLLRKRNEK